MSTPYESADLILKLFDMRREAVLREARDWFIRTFHPESVDDVIAVLQSEDNAKFRMVVGYWDMAASLVTHGAVGRQMFLDANSEIFATFSKVFHVLEDLRETIGRPDYLSHIEDVVLSAEGAEDRLETLRVQLRSLGESSEDA